MLKPSVVSIGAGNVAWHLIPCLYKKQYPVLCVYSRKQGNARELGNKVNARFTGDYKKIPLDADIYLITLTDHAIQDAVDFLQGVNGTVIHTAGSIDMNIFSGKINRYGVLYPVQTFSKTKKLHLSDIPFLVEASDDKALKEISGLAADLSDTVQVMNSEQRRRIHLAAVFSCNFVNHMLTCADDILTAGELDFSLLLPLLKETISKAVEGNPADIQTGPAVRGNIETLKKQASMLKDRPDLQNLYTFVSKSIYEYHTGRKNQIFENE